MNRENLIKILSLGESKNIEFRSSIQYNMIGRTICAFLNSGGGYVVCGVNNKGEITGVDKSSINTADLEQSIHLDITPKALISFEIHGIEEKAVLVIEVPAGKDAPYAFKNEINFREGERTVKADVDTIRDLVMKRQIEPERWERRFSSAEIETDLSLTEILAAVNQISSSLKMQFRDNNNRLMALEDLSVFKYGRLTNAGDVLFTSNPAKRYPQVRVKAACFTSDKTDSSYLDMKSYEGPLVTTLEDVYGFIARNTPTKVKFSNSSLERIDEPLYPSAAIREGLVNAFVHRDYSDFSGGIHVFVYPNRLEIRNSGSFPDGITPENLGTGLSVLRNPDIAHVLYLRNYMEKLGRGSLMIRKACEEKGLPAPKWHSDNNGVALTFFTPEVTTEVAPQVTTEVATEVTTEVTTEVVRVIKAIKGEMSRQELQTLLGLKNDEHFRKSYLIPALSAGMIEMTIPEKPRSGNQKYRITVLGKKVLAKES
jgi:ATP-dependent DNA helicase RecG